ncbi:MAG: ImmA/IrrE family metallo-endopeptidase [Planctomycetes bacterium]|jgi:hypothetical protein|nr:ImmA/IrrE family metallo-endopeptidase [Planctomycetota bacterium]
MIHKSADRWIQRVRPAAIRARSLTSRFGLESVPLPIGRIAGDAGVEEFVCQPLLVPGALAVRNDRYVVYLHSEGEAESSTLLGALRAEGDWGQSLPSRVRFTVAHEVAHILLGHPGHPQMAMGRRGATARWKELERNCNHIAGRLLVPVHLRDLAVREMGSIGCPRDLLELARRFGVSASTLVLALNPLGKLTIAPTAVLVVRPAGRILRIDASVLSAAMSKCAPRLNFRYGADFGEFYRGSRLTLAGGPDQADEIRDSASGASWTVRSSPVTQSETDFLVTVTLAPRSS